MHVIMKLIDGIQKTHKTITLLLTPAHTDALRLIQPIEGNTIADKLANEGADGLERVTTQNAMFDTRRDEREASPANLPYLRKKLSPMLMKSLCKIQVEKERNWQWIALFPRSDYWTASRAD